jgi:hypothetical protein
MGHLAQDAHGSIGELSVSEHLGRSDAGWQRRLGERGDTCYVCSAFKQEKRTRIRGKSSRQHKSQCQPL